MSSNLDAGGFIMVLRSDMTDLHQAGDYCFTLAVWLALNSEANRQRSTAAEVSLAELQRQTGISKPKILSTLDALESTGFIQIGRKAAVHHGRPLNRYLLLKGRHSILPHTNPKTANQETQP